MLSTFRIVAVAPVAFLTLILFFKVTNVSTIDPSTTEDKIGKDAVYGEYVESCSMANLLVATRQYKDSGRYAYGLTVDCVFFWFDLVHYETIEQALDYFQYQWDLPDTAKLLSICPVDMFNIRYVSQGKEPYFEIIDLQSGSLHQIKIDKEKTKDRRLSFEHFTTSSSIKPGWKFARSGWAGFHENLLIHAKPIKNQLNGKMEVKTYVRLTNEINPGGCIMQSYHDHLLFQIVPIIGKEAANLTKFFDEGWPTKDQHPAAEYYFWGILSVIVVAFISVFGCLGLIIWKLRDYFKMEAKRREIEQFVVGCYVEKLDKFFKATLATKMKAKKVKNKVSKSSKSVNSHHHRLRYYSDPELPHGSRILPIPDEKDLFASDKKKPISKLKTTQRAPSRGSNASVCSLRSLTQSVEDSLDWTAKGVPMSKRQIASKLLQEDEAKEEKEAFKLGMSVPSYRKKLKQQQRHGFNGESTNEKKPKQPSDAGMRESVPIAQTPTKVTASQMLKGSITLEDEVQIARAEQEILKRSEDGKRKKSEQEQNQQPDAMTPKSGGSGVQLVKDDSTYGSLIVPGPVDISLNPKKPKKK